MIVKIKSTFLLIFSLGMLSISLFGQSVEEKINLEKKNIIESEKRILELEKQKIKEHEEKIKKLEAESEGNSLGDKNQGNTIESPRTVAPSLPQNINNSTTTVEPITNTIPANNQSQNNCLINTLNSAEATRLQKAVCRLTGKILSERSNELSPNRVAQQIVTVLAANETEKSFFLESERKRTDKQVGSSPDSSGTTSLAVKGGTPAIIGWAVEQGAATSSFSGNTVTVRVNPLNLGKALFYNQGILEIKDVKLKEDAFDTFLKKLSLGFSFDTTRGTDTPAFTGDTQQLSAFSFRYEFINRRNPLSPRYKDKRLNFFNSQTENLDKVARAINTIIDAENDTFKNESLTEWLIATNTELSRISPNLDPTARRAQVQAVIEKRLKELPTEEISKDENIKNAIRSFTEGSIGFKESRDKFVEELNKGMVVTFEYTNNREPIAPDTSNFRFIWEKGILRNTDFTFNASLTMYNKKPVAVGVRRIRDFQFALQTDTPLKNTFGLGDSILSFAGRYERLNSDTVDALGLVKPNSKGDIALGQIKLTIPIGDTGIRLPFSATFSNRTELIKESTVRGNFGITFDLDPLFARFKPF